ncbi:MAG TPA: SDR family NAD(P)-dependent oxidoreductase, partial [Spirochaetia bacterium]|nr:SDR family NAD(P)-dependent oxidoreductase [Spirochaetia bacterium]
MSCGTALVTGATNGIGWEIAFLLAEHGYHLLVTGRDPARLRKLETDLRGKVPVKGVAADLSREEGVATLIAAVRDSGAVPEILVNNAGLGDRGPFVEADLERQRAIMEVNMVSLVRLTRELLPSMVQRGHGRILNVASTAAFLPGPLMSIYYASK